MAVDLGCGNGHIAKALEQTAGAGAGGIKTLVQLDMSSE